MVDGVGLVAVLGRRVAQPDVVVGVVGGQGDGAVSPFTGHRQRTIGPDRRDGPRLPVADRLAGRRDKGAVVAAGGDDVTDVGALSAGDRRDESGLSVSGGDSGGLDGVVDGVDMIIGGGDEGDGAARLLVFDPRVGHRGEVIVECAGDDPVVGLVGVEGAGITGSQLQRRGSLPVVFEAVEAFELVDSAVGAQLGEQAATADGLQLAMVTDEHEAPLVRLGETHELMQGRGGDHPGLVDDERRPAAEAGTRVVAAGRGAATHGAVWRRCRRASRCPVRVPGLLSPSGRHRTRHDAGRAGR